MRTVPGRSAKAYLYNRPILLLGLLGLFVFFLTRLILLVQVAGAGSSFGLMAAALTIGLLYDLTVAFILVLPLLLQITFISEFICTRRDG
ncbi:MAG: hypothetical protein QM755_01845 [Luteolibacter sp.]